MNQWSHNSSGWCDHPAFARAVQLLNQYFSRGVRLPSPMAAMVRAIEDDIATVYATPAGYPTWARIKKALALYASSNIVRGICPSSKVDNFYADPDVATAQVSMFTSVEQCAPVRHVSASVVESFLKTRPPELASPPLMSLPHFILSLPCGALRDDVSSKTVEFISVNQAEYDDSTWIVATAILSDSSPVNVRFVFDEDAAPQPDLSVCSSVFQEDLAFAEKVKRIVANSLLVMAHKPEMVTSELLPPASGAGFRCQSLEAAPRSVIWIGKNYKPRRRERTRQDDVECTPVATHWRAGHWHTVRHGAGRKKARLQWYEPILVNAAVAAFP
jgi:hypothetical protein